MIDLIYMQKLLYRMDWTDSAELMQQQVLEAASTLQINLPRSMQTRLLIHLEDHQERASDATPQEVVFAWIRQNSRHFGNKNDFKSVDSQSAFSRKSTSQNCLKV